MFQLRKGCFLRKVREGGCRLFGVFLSPDHNDADRDRLHFHQAGGREWGWRACRRGRRQEGLASLQRRKGMLIVAR
jgi:hypothetical protein